MHSLGPVSVGAKSTNHPRLADRLAGREEKDSVSAETVEHGGKCTCAHLALRGQSYALILEKVSSAQ